MTAPTRARTRPRTASASLVQVGISTSCMRTQSPRLSARSLSNIRSPRIRITATSQQGLRRGFRTGQTAITIRCRISSTRSSGRPRIPAPMDSPSTARPAKRLSPARIRSTSARISRATRPLSLMAIMPTAMVPARPILRSHRLLSRLAMAFPVLNFARTTMRMGIRTGLFRPTVIRPRARTHSGPGSIPGGRSRQPKRHKGI